MKILTMRKRLANRKRASKPVILMKNHVILATTDEQHEVVATIVANAKQASVAKQSTLTNTNTNEEQHYENTERDTSLITERKVYNRQLRDMATLQQGQTQQFDANNKSIDKSTGYPRCANFQPSSSLKQRRVSNNSSLCDEPTCCNSNTRQVVNTTSD